MHVPEVNRDKQPPCRKDEKHKPKRQRDVCTQYKGRLNTACKHSGRPFFKGTLHLSSLETWNWGLSCLLPLSEQRCTLSAEESALLVHCVAIAQRKQILEFTIAYSSAKRFGTFYCESLHFKQQFESHLTMAKC